MAEVRELGLSVGVVGKKSVGCAVPPGPKVLRQCRRKEPYKDFPVTGTDQEKRTMSPSRWAPVPGMKHWWSWLNLVRAMTAFWACCSVRKRSCQCWARAKYFWVPPSRLAYFSCNVGILFFGGFFLPPMAGFFWSSFSFGVNGFLNVPF